MQEKLEKIRGKNHKNKKILENSAKNINEQRFLEKPEKNEEKNKEEEHEKTVTKGILDLLDEKINN